MDRKDDLNEDRYYADWTIHEGKSKNTEIAGKDVKKEIKNEQKQEKKGIKELQKDIKDGYKDYEHRAKDSNDPLANEKISAAKEESKELRDDIKKAVNKDY